MPISHQAFADAVVQDKDLSSTIIVSEGFHTHRTGTSRQLFALAEGPVVVIDTVTPGPLADNFTGGCGATYHIIVDLFAWGYRLCVILCFVPMLIGC